MSKHVVPRGCLAVRATVEDVIKICKENGFRVEGDIDDAVTCFDERGDICYRALRKAPDAWLCMVFDTTQVKWNK